MGNSSYQKPCDSRKRNDLGLATAITTDAHFAKIQKLKIRHKL